MIILDTDHLSVLQRPSERERALRQRLSLSPDQDIAATIISAEEQMRGRLADVRRFSTGRDLVRAYEWLSTMFDFWKEWTLLPFDDSAATIFETFPPRLVQRVGPMDCKIAAIVLARGATLLSANLVDFQQVPGIHVEDWLRA